MSSQKRIRTSLAPDSDHGRNFTPPSPAKRSRRKSKSRRVSRRHSGANTTPKMLTPTAMQSPLGLRHSPRIKRLDDYGFFASAERCTDCITDPVSVSKNAAAWRLILDGSDHDLADSKSGEGHSEEIIDLVYQGIPNSMRGEVWAFLLRGSRNQGQNESQSYTDYLAMVETDYEGNLIDGNGDSDGRPSAEVPGSPAGGRSALKQIRLDLDRTYVDHSVFSTPAGQERLYKVLAAYSKRNVEVGYCQGMSYLAGLLLMYMDDETSFWCLAAMVEGRMKGFFDPSLSQVHVESNVFGELLKLDNPTVADLFEKHGIHPLVYTARWFLSLYTTLPCWPSVLACWDLFCLFGIDALHRVGLAVLESISEQIVSMDDASLILSFLVSMPKESITPEQIMTLGRKCDSSMASVTTLRESFSSAEELRPSTRSREKDPADLASGSIKRKRDRMASTSTPEPISLFARLSTPLRHLTGRFEADTSKTKPKRFRLRMGSTPAPAPPTKAKSKGKGKGMLGLGPDGLQFGVDDRSALREFSTPKHKGGGRGLKSVTKSKPRSRLAVIHDLDTMDSPASPSSVFEMKSIEKKEKGKGKKGKKSALDDAVYNRIVRQSIGPPTPSASASASAGDMGGSGKRKRFEDSDSDSDSVTFYSAVGTPARKLEF